MSSWRVRAVRGRGVAPVATAVPSGFATAAKADARLYSRVGDFYAASKGPFAAGLAFSEA